MRFYKKHILLFLLLTLVFTESCKKDNNNKELPVLSQLEIDVQTHEFTSVVFTGNLNEQYVATFGDTDIDLIKTSDSTLSFTIPEVSAGNYDLNFELGKLTYNVSKTEVFDARQILVEVFDDFDNNIVVLQNDTTMDQSRVANAVAFKDDVEQLINSLSTSQIEEVALLFVANKEMFQSFKTSVNSILDAPVVLSGKQSDCPKTNGFKAFYSCTANNLGLSVKELVLSSRELLEWVAYTVALYQLSPAALAAGPVGIGAVAVGASLSTITTIYIFFTDVYPPLIDLFSKTGSFLQTNWIFTKAFFIVMAEEFLSEQSTNSNIDGKFRSLNEDDGLGGQGKTGQIEEGISPDVTFFINTYLSLTSLWGDLASLLGAPPSFSSSEKDVELETSNISITNISNANVQLVDINDEYFEFKSLSGNDEYFSYDLTINIQGFTEKVTLDARVLIPQCTGLSSVTDPRDGEVYQTIQIGNQTWFAENLRYQGGNLNQVTDQLVWSDLDLFEEPAWCYYDNDVGMDSLFGKLYNWYAVDSLDLCPSGWHVPTDTEWQTLIDYLGGDNVAGGKMKKVYNGWAAASENSSCFSALGAGYRSVNGSFIGFPANGYFWSSTDDQSSPFYRHISPYDDVARANTSRKSGLSCRCIRD